MPIELPDWTKTIIAHYESGAAGQFLLHGNIDDHFLLPLQEKPRLGTLSDFLMEILLPRFQVILTYDPGHGLRVERGREIFHSWPAIKDAPDLPTQALATARLLSRYLQYVRNLRSMGAPAPAVAILLRDASLYLPNLPQVLNADLAALASVVRSLATENSTHQHGQAVFLMCDRLHALHALVAQNPRACAIEIPLPKPAELADVFSHFSPTFPNTLALWKENFTQPASRLAGTSVAALETFLRLREHAKQPLLQSDLGELRKSLVERDSEGLIEFIEPKKSLEQVLGLDGVKSWLRQDLQLWQQDDLAALPMGYLFCGPVGTGKTYLAECLAGEAGVPVVVLKNFRDRWVGATEANLEKIFALLHALGRCIVFVDEADQALGRRQADNGDSGVSSRVYSMIAAEMSSQENRGRILWVLASSRPDLIEVDLKRPGRIDVKIPIFPAGSASEGLSLLAGLCKRHGAPLNESELPDLLTLVPPWLTPGAAEAIAVKTYRLTRTEKISPIQALRQCLNGYRPPVDPAIIRQQMQLAAAEATDASFVPEAVHQFLSGI
ncbi:ATP-binding protein [Luteolibacter pohnpeiensis]|uniref:ATP-binding protein n=1 Tax=Luteolibacter pohnpeiensis TaxID=454153 RepID=A0A934VSU6_9BACT|nr:AAA family ATPase [Luteolibacter pohnpeiensis]MBK1880792.1 ATP-binding protein [Luteolibacter pohnpeiensis]